MVEQQGAIRNRTWSETRITIPWRRVAVYATLALGFFLLGFVPLWFKANTAIEQRDAAQHELRFRHLENTLSAALIDVQRGEFEPARQTMSDFYSDLRAQLDSDNSSGFTDGQRHQLKPFLGQRDEIITLLARSDPAAADRLFTLYSSLKKTGKY